MLCLIKVKRGGISLVVQCKNPPCEAADAGSIPDGGIKTPHAAGQLRPQDATDCVHVLCNLCGNTRAPAWHKKKDLAWRNKDPMCLNEDDAAKSTNQWKVQEKSKFSQSLILRLDTAKSINKKFKRKSKFSQTLMFVSSGSQSPFWNWGSLEHVGSATVVIWLSCLVAFGILVPRPELDLMSPAFQGRLLTTGPPWKSLWSLLRRQRLTKSLSSWGESSWKHWRENWTDINLQAPVAVSFLRTLADSHAFGPKWRLKGLQTQDQCLLAKGFFFFLWIEVAQGRMIKSKAKAWKGRRESLTLSLCWRQSPTRLLTDSYTTGRWWTGGRQIESHCNYNWTLTQFSSHQDLTVQYHTLSAQQRRELTIWG